MEARALPQEENLLEVIENIQQKVWSEIETKIIGFTKQLIEQLLEEKVKQLIGAQALRAYPKAQGLPQRLLPSGSVNQVRQC